MRQCLPSKTVDEAQVVTFDFTNEAGGTLTSPSIAKSTIVGTDPSASSLTLSAPLVSGAQVSSLVSAGTDECSYQLLCTVNDSTGEVYQQSASITVTTAAA